MTLLQIRTQFAKISGRYDLVSPSDFSDAGANFYIQQGQRSLERRMNISPTRAKFYDDIALGTYKVTLTNCRAIHSVWVMDSDSRTEVIKIEDYDLRATHQLWVENMYSTPLSTMSTGRPNYYYPTNLRRSSETETGSGDSATLSSYMDTTYPYDSSASGIILLPRCDKAYGIEIQGLFYSPTLTNNSDENYWSGKHPNLLLWAALRELEIMYRGHKSATSWDSYIEAEIANLDKDDIEMQLNSVDQLEG